MPYRQQYSVIDLSFYIRARVRRDLCLASPRHERVPFIGKHSTSSIPKKKILAHDHLDRQRLAALERASSFDKVLAPHAQSRLRNNAITGTSTTTTTTSTTTTVSTISSANSVPMSGTSTDASKPEQATAQQPDQHVRLPGINDGCPPSRGRPRGVPVRFVDPSSSSTLPTEREQCVTELSTSRCTPSSKRHARVQCLRSAPTPPRGDSGIIEDVHGPHDSKTMDCSAPCFFLEPSHCQHPQHRFVHVKQAWRPFAMRPASARARSRSQSPTTFLEQSQQRSQSIASPAFECTTFHPIADGKPRLFSTDV